MKRVCVNLREWLTEGNDLCLACWAESPQAHLQHAGPDNAASCQASATAHQASCGQKLTLEEVSMCVKPHLYFGKAVKQPFDVVSCVFCPEECEASDANTAHGLEA